MAAANEETQPYLKVQESGDTVCFADTADQVKNAFDGQNYLGGGRDSMTPAVNNHMMLFGVEDFNTDKARNVATAFTKSTVPFQRIEIFGCTINEQVQETLAEGFDPKTNDNMQRIKRIDLDNSKLTAKGAKAIFTNLAECNSIEKINLQGSVPSADVVTAINEALVDQCNLLGDNFNYLDLKINDLPEASGLPLKSLMQKFRNPEGVHLDVFYNNLKVPGAQAIGQGLGEDAKIVHLDLSCNEIGDPGALAIANGIRTNSYIKTLKLALNNIGNAGGIAILGAIAPIHGTPAASLPQCNSSIEYLDLSANIMKQEGKADTLAVTPAAPAANADEMPSAAMFEDALGGNEDAKNQVEAQHEANVPGLVNVSLMAHMAEVWGKQKTVDGESRSQLKEFDFTGIEFDQNNWAAFAALIAGSLRETHDGVSREETNKCIIKFSIVDLMNETNLKVLEGRIWNSEAGNEAKNPLEWKWFPAVDWRRLPEEKAEEKAN